jgi:uncharacterized protein YqeY
MELFEKIKEMRTQALKSGDKFLHSVMTNLFSDVNPVGTNITPPTDETVQKVVKKHLDGVVETLEHIKGKVEADVVALKEREKEILESLRPAQLAEEALVAILQELQPKALKDWMAHLKTNFAQRYDGKLAKKVFESLGK